MAVAGAAVDLGPAVGTRGAVDPGVVVATRGLGKRYRSGVVALDGLTLALRRGEVLGYLGPNGAGKTTTIRLLLGLLRPTTGSATLFGVDAWTGGVSVHRRVGYVPADARLYPRMTGGRLVAHLGRLRGGVDPRRVAALAERLDVDLRQQVRALSHGNRQKLVILQAMAGAPDLLVLDEPTTGLDPLVQQEFQALVAEHVAAGGSVLLSSHVLAEVERLAGRVGILRGGRLVAVERLEDLRAKALHHVSARLAAPVPGERFARVPGLRDLRVEGSTLTCSAPQESLDALVKALAGLPVLDLACHEADLEETFLAYYGNGAGDAA